MSLSDRSRDLRNASTQRLTEFLRVDVEVGFTFADKAKTEKQSGMEAFERCKDKAERALSAVRSFLTDPLLNNEVEVKEAISVMSSNSNVQFQSSSQIGTQMSALTRFELLLSIHDCCFELNNALLISSVRHARHAIPIKRPHTFGEQKANIELYSLRGRREGIICSAAICREDLLRMQSSASSASS